MKKILVLTLGWIMASAPSWGAVNYVDESINQSSFSKTSDSFVTISTYPNDTLLSVVVGTATGGGVLTLFDGTTAPFISTIGIVNLGTVQNPFFYVLVTSGISYNASANANGFTIIYRNRKVSLSRF